jgi:very-short-patch-repair endonuclease
VYLQGEGAPSQLDEARAAAFAVDGIAVDSFAGALNGFDMPPFTRTEILVHTTASVKRPGVRRVRTLPTDTVVIGQVRCLSPQATLRWLARTQDDVRWEQALESAFRLGLVDPNKLVDWIGGYSDAPRRILRVIDARGGLAVPPTESVLETMSIQLIRAAGLAMPERQVEVYDEYGNFVARVDQAWPEVGAFLELDGQQHADQPVYDSSRETAVVAATGWLCGRVTWREASRSPVATARRLTRLLAQARARPLSVPATLTTKVL